MVISEFLSFSSASSKASAARAKTLRSVADTQLPAVSDVYSHASASNSSVLRFTTISYSCAI